MPSAKDRSVTVAICCVIFFAVSGFFILSPRSDLRALFFGLDFAAFGVALATWLLAFRINDRRLRLWLAIAFGVAVALISAILGIVHLPGMIEAVNGNIGYRGSRIAAPLSGSLLTIAGTTWLWNRRHWLTKSPVD